MKIDTRQNSELSDFTKVRQHTTCVLSKILGSLLYVILSLTADIERGFEAKFRSPFKLVMCPPPPLGTPHTNYPHTTDIPIPTEPSYTPMDRRSSLHMNQPCKPNSPSQRQSER